MKFLRLKEVCEKISLKKSCIFKMMSLGNFPKQVKLGPRASAWIEDEVEEWCQQRKSPEIIPNVQSGQEIIDEDINKLLTLRKILKLGRINKTKLSGVYFLICEEEIVYIGKSLNVFSRIEHHHRDNEKQFDDFTYINVHFNQMDVIEAKYIREFRPKYNLLMHKKILEREMIRNMASGEGIQKN